MSEDEEEWWISVWKMDDQVVAFDFKILIEHVERLDKCLFVLSVLWSFRSANEEIRVMFYSCELCGPLLYAVNVSAVDLF